MSTKQQRMLALEENFDRIVDYAVKIYPALLNEDLGEFESYAEMAASEAFKIFMEAQALKIRVFEIGEEMLKKSKKQSKKGE